MARIRKNFLLDEETASTLREMAEAYGLTESEVIRTLIRNSAEGKILENPSSSQESANLHSSERTERVKQALKKLFWRVEKG